MCEYGPYSEGGRIIIKGIYPGIKPRVFASTAGAGASPGFPEIAQRIDLKLDGKNFCEPFDGRRGKFARH